MDDLKKAGNEKVGSKGETQGPEQGGFGCFLCRGDVQNLCLFQIPALFGRPGGVQDLLLCPREGAGGEDGDGGGSED